MAVLKMQFVNIVGPIKEFDEFAKESIINSNIQLENVLSVIGNSKGLYPFLDENPYDTVMKKGLNISNAINIEEGTNNKINEEYLIEDIEKYFDNIKDQIDKHHDEKEEILKNINDNKQIIKQLINMDNVDIRLDKLFNLKFIKFRFGKLPKDSYKKLQIYLSGLEVFVALVHSEKDYNYIMYFMPESYKEKIDSIFSSLYFERIRISEKAFGTPEESLKNIIEENKKLEQELLELDKKYEKLLKDEKSKFINYYSYIKMLYDSHNVRKYAGHTKESFYISGWMPKDELKLFIKNIDKDKSISYVIEEPEMVKRASPPTELKNHRIFKPFESIVKTYGLPSYNEVDPTIFVSIVYVFLFGMMFGDIGQGAILALGGYYLYYKKKINLGGVLIPVGISSMIFGLLYGSIFGYENIIKPLWIHPMEEITNIMIISIGVGIFLISVSMIINLINKIKNKELVNILFDKNGIAGFVFYWGVLLLAVYYLRKGEMLIPVVLAGMILALSLLCIAFKELLENIIHKKKKLLPDDRGSFIAESLFEIFDTVLGFVSNTISFVRVSAFALNHIGLFMAIFILANMLNGAGNIIVVIIGNIIIIGLEGLIVGIQDLRLTYYELFSRFFVGEGIPFKPIKATEKQ
jgi:V/A-type H+-transporting ATPase subunit I